MPVEPRSDTRASPLATAALIIGTCLSIATTCGPPEPRPIQLDTGYYWRDTGYTDPDYGFTTIVSAPVSLEGVGDTEVHTIRVVLDDRCTMETSDYAWGYPGGWVLGSAVLEEGAGPADTGTTDTAPPPPDTGTDTGDSGTSVDTGTVDTGSVDTGSVDTGAVDTGTSDTGTSDTGASDTGGTSGDTGFWGWDTGDAPPSAKVRVDMVRSDGVVLPPVRLRLAEDGTARDAVFDETPFSTCSRDEVCTLDWTVTFTLVEGEAVHGTLDANVRLRMCSSGPPITSDMSATVD